MSHIRLGALAALALTFVLAACSTDNDLVATPNLEAQFGTVYDDVSTAMVTGSGSSIYNLYNYVDPAADCNDWYCWDYREIAVLERYSSSGNLVWQQDVLNVDCYDNYCNTYRAEAVFVDSNNYTYVLISDYYGNEPDGSGAELQYHIQKYAPLGEQVGTIYLDYFHAFQDQISFRMTIDSGGSIYVAAQNRSYPDSYVAKYSSTGNLLWKRSSFTPYPYGTPQGITVTSAGNVYIIGSKGMARYSSTGNLVWTKTGSAYAVGQYSKIVASGTNLYTRNTNLVRKYDANGKLLWSKSQTGLTGLNLADITADATGNVYLTGKYRPTSTSQANVFTRKLKPTGAVLWTKTFGTPEYDDGRSIATTNGSEIYVAGATLGSLAHTSIGGSDGYLRKLNSLGNPVWTR